MKNRLRLLALLLLAACADNTATPAPADLSVQIKIDMTFHSDCGHPGDVGNSVGVGKFCMKVTACSSNTKATLCTTLGSDRNYFCTTACDSAGPANYCGENA